MLWIGEPQDSRKFILHQESSLNFRSILTQKLRHFDKVRFLVSSYVQSSNSHKCKKNLVSAKDSVIKQLINNKLKCKILEVVYMAVA
jgi:hypothetical protein